ncbi:beta/gamma crystallin domain-containing protein 2-like [Ambystoma mexicanum]|uniref:beta/gamma crystallin domain-containing protein 2-like n=1 Tax=Ambystoma mexicanum TaxID=8296 RepID=UPI0037E96782
MKVYYDVSLYRFFLSTRQSLVPEHIGVGVGEQLATPLHILQIRSPVTVTSVPRTYSGTPDQLNNLTFSCVQDTCPLYVAPDMSLQVIGAANKGAKVVLWSQSRIPCQTWRINANGHIHNQLFERMILDVKGGQVYDRDHVVLWDVAEERPTQLWTIEVL